MTPITKSVETTPLSSSRPRPQYNYFYGSAADGTDALTVTTNDTLEQESLIGEVLVQTDNEDETYNGHNHDIQHLMIANGNAGRKSWVPGTKLASSNGLGRVLFILLLAASVSIFFILMIPHTSHPLVDTQTIEIPFEKVNRADYGDPVEGLLNLNLFHPTLISNVDQRTFNFPFPTGAFWTNLVVPSPESVYSYPIVVYPYAYKWSDKTLQLSYPAAHRVEDESHHWIADPFAPDLTLSTIETITSRYLTRFDPLSVTLRFIATAESKFETTLVQGSPYTTIKYLNATPTIQALSTFKSVQCPGEEMEDFHDLFDDEDDDDSRRRHLFGVCSLEVRRPVLYTVSF
jgi:endoglucanase Acf2